MKREHEACYRMCTCVRVCVTKGEREREVVVVTSSRYCRHQLHGCARNAEIPERQGKRERERRKMREGGREGENGKDLGF